MEKSALFTSLSPHWGTPAAIYEELDREFSFDFDPCPIGGTDGLTADWTGRRVFCNPPYGPGMEHWLAKANGAALAVFLIPARTDTLWFHEIVLPNAREVRFIKRRLRFVRTGARPGGRAPFPSMVVVFDRWCAP